MTSTPDAWLLDKTDKTGAALDGLTPPAEFSEASMLCKVGPLILLHFTLSIYDYEKYKPNK